MIGFVSLLQRIFSFTRDGIITTTYGDDAVVKKQAYSIRQVFTIPSGSIKQIVFDPSLLDHDVFLEPFRLSTTAGPIKVRIVPGVSIVSGTNELPVLNRYGLIDNPIHKLKCYDVFTGLDEEDFDPLEYALGSQSTNQNSGGGVTTGSNIFAFEIDKKYLLEFDNDFGSGDAAIVSLQLDWFEL